MNIGLINPYNRYLVYNNVYKIKSTLGFIRKYTKLLGKDSVQVNLLRNGRPNIISTNTVINSFKSEIVLFPKNYSSDSSDNFRLMDMRVRLLPNIIQILKIRCFSYFTLKQFDNTFYMAEFLENTSKVLEIVSRLLSEEKLSDLDGLLTKECKAEVEKNIKTLTPVQKMALAVKANDILYVVPCQIDIIKDKENKEKIFAQIMVIFHAVKNLLDLNKPLNIYNDDIIMDRFIVYNVRFIREFTPGVEDQWTINAINVLKIKNKS